jgi:ABC-type uncharacterized transport system ATPase subunit
VERLCHRVLVLLEGRVAGMETVARDEAASLLLEVGDGEAARALLAGLEGVFWRDETRLEVRGSAAEQVRRLSALVEGGIEVRALETRRPSLEERFLARVGSEPVEAE